jgi:hypothetical protein
VEGPIVIDDQTDIATDAFAAELARMGGLPRLLLEQHTDDGSGHCAICSEGGQAGRYVYPCTLRTAAIRALTIQARMHAERDPTGQGVVWLVPGYGPERPERPR